MRVHGEMLAAKLQAVLEVVHSSPSPFPSDDDLAKAVASREFDVFRYRYREANGSIADGYTTAETIGDYVELLTDLGLLDEATLRPTVASQDLEPFSKFCDHLSSLAKDELRTKGAGVDAIRQGSAEILSGSEAQLPTLDELHSRLNTSLPLRRFKWLVNLYALSEAAIMGFSQRPLLLPRRYLGE